MQQSRTSSCQRSLTYFDGKTFKLPLMELAPSYSLHAETCVIIGSVNFKCNVVQWPLMALHAL